MTLSELPPTAGVTPEYDDPNANDDEDSGSIFDIIDFNDQTFCKEKKNKFFGERVFWFFFTLCRNDSDAID